MLNIPKNLISGFRALVDLPINEVKVIAEFLPKIPLGTGPNDFHNKLQGQFDIENISIISNTIFSLGNLLLKKDNNGIENIANDLITSLTKKVKSPLEQNEIDDLKQKLYIILYNSENLKSTFKALSLLSENDIVYRDSRIITDMRLLFDDDNLSESNNRKALIIHRLRIEAYKNETFKNFYISLDSKDLSKLKESIDRALDKEQEIKNSYSENIYFINPTE